jgi:hypothetical protein
MNTGILINVDPSTEIKRDHICYYVTKEGLELKLIEVVNVWYQHPDGPADIPRLETHIVLKTSITRDDHPEVFLLYNQQLATRELNSDNQTETNKEEQIKSFSDFRKQDQSAEVSKPDSIFDLIVTKFWLKLLKHDSKK